MTKWHASIESVPGIRWVRPATAKADPAFAEMRPRPRTGVFALPGDIEWSDGTQRIEEPWTGASPCEHLSNKVYDASTTGEITDLTFRALLAPGTLSDYLEAVRFGTTHLQMRGAGGPEILSVQEAGMALIEADPGAARDAKRKTGQAPERVLRDPYVTAAGILLNAGMLREAVAIEAREVAVLGSNPGPEGRPAHDAVAALRELQDVAS